MKFVMKLCKSKLRGLDIRIQKNRGVKKIFQFNIYPKRVVKFSTEKLKGKRESETVKAAVLKVVH